MKNYNWEGFYQGTLWFWVFTYKMFHIGISDMEGPNDERRYPSPDLCCYYFNKIYNPSYKETTFKSHFWNLYINRILLSHYKYDYS